MFKTMFLAGFDMDKKETSIMRCNLVLSFDDFVWWGHEIKAYILFLGLVSRPHPGNSFTLYYGLKIEFWVTLQSSGTCVQ
jgi:hypothetical protein